MWRQQQTKDLRQRTRANNNMSYEQVALDERETDGLTTRKEKDGVEPLEVDLGGNDVPQVIQEENLFMWRNPWLVFVFIVLFLVVPSLCVLVKVLYDLTGKIWPATFVSVHLSCTLWVARCMVPTDGSRSRTSVWRRTIYLIVDVWLFGSFYAGITSFLTVAFFTDVDETPIIEWTGISGTLGWFERVGFSIAGIRVWTELLSLSFVCCRRRYGDGLSRRPNWLISVASCLGWFETLGSRWSPSTRKKIRTLLRWTLSTLFLASLGFLFWCFNSVIIHWGSWEPPSHSNALCDPLDTTECCLPFPSFHHLVENPSTATGWQVNLRGELLPPLRGGAQLQPAFLNRLDGFSTMAPMLFYLDGMKEGYEGGLGKAKLQGHEYLEKSITEESVTLLLDVELGHLVPHSAEIDYLDPKHPLVMVFPTSPLRHNAHYALSVIGAVDGEGKEIPQTPGMKELFSGNGDAKRLARYTNILIPELNKAAPWTPHDFSKIQLLFDFKTISEESQLGAIRKVRDTTMKILNSESWGSWSKHVRTVSIKEGNCQIGSIARTVHGELDVPWFLTDYGSGHRAALLDNGAVEVGAPKIIGKAKFIVHIPCSLRAAAIRGPNATDMRAIVEFGHGLFFDREEAGESFLVDMANAHGHVLVAMDWRGMSVYDLFIVIKTLMAKPHMFESLRDNLIQGYANKYCLQHFLRNGFLEMPWLKFQSGKLSSAHAVPTFEGKLPAFTFYGISQGGILGAGYSALSGLTGLVDRAVLGVPGSPFALVLSRSLEFKGYDAVLLLNFYNNRHVRILLYLTQMGWDPTEGAGVLAPPVKEPVPPTLLQSGLGDAIVTSLSAEVLGRAYNATTVPNNPRAIYGIPPTGDGLAVLTEFLYEEEYQALPKDDKFAEKNTVHICLRRKPSAVRQVAEFINTGEIVDVCADNGCKERDSNCTDEDGDPPKRRRRRFERKRKR